MTTLEISSNQTEPEGMEISDKSSFNSLPLKFEKESSLKLLHTVESKGKTDNKKLQSNSNICHHAEKMKNMLLPRLYEALELAYDSDPNKEFSYIKRFKPSVAGESNNLLHSKTNKASSRHSDEILAKKLEDAEKTVEQLQKKCNQLQKREAELTSSHERRISEEVAAASTSQLQEKNQELETRLQEYKRKQTEMEGTIRNLNGMNLQWQEYNKKKDAAMKKLQESFEELKERNRQLQTELDRYSDESSDIVFTEAQQRVIDGFYQRIREDADLFRDQRDATVQDAQHNISVAKQRQETAEKIAEDLQKKVEAYELEEIEYKQQIDELQAALVVAARRSNQPAPDQNLIQNLKEKLKRCEEDCKRISGEYQNVLSENSKLTQRLHDTLMHRRRGPTHVLSMDQRSSQQPSSMPVLDTREETRSLVLPSVESDQLIVLD